MPGCPDGSTPQIIPGSQELQTLVASTIVGTLVAGELDWFATIAAGVGYLTFDLLNLCSQGPPGFPNWDPARVASYFDPTNPNATVNLRTDATNAIATLIWSQYCECVTGGNPVIPPAPPQPNGIAIDNPQGQTPTGTPCLTQGQIFETTAPTSSGVYTWSILGLPTLPFPSAQWIQFKWNAGNANPESQYPLYHTVEWTNAQGLVLQTDTWTQTADIVFANQLTRTYNWPAGTTGLSWTTKGNGNASSALTMDMSMLWYCTPAPESLAQPCCPPDPTLENLLIQVMQLEQLILQQLNVPQKYTLGTAHPGLTGSGTIAVSGLFGVLVQLTAGTPTTPQLPGVPPYEWSVGWISCLTGDGMIDEIRLTRQNQVWASRLAPYATEFGYQLNQGFTATITELLPVTTAGAASAAP